MNSKENLNNITIRLIKKYRRICEKYYITNHKGVNKTINTEIDYYIDYDLNQYEYEYDIDIIDRYYASIPLVLTEEQIEFCDNIIYDCDNFDISNMTIVGELLFKAKLDDSKLIIKRYI